MERVEIQSRYVGEPKQRGLRADLQSEKYVGAESLWKEAGWPGSSVSRSCCWHRLFDRREADLPCLSGGARDEQMKKQWAIHLQTELGSF